jgi:membrane-bound lytic murein transglycosylase D
MRTKFIISLLLLTVAFTKQVKAIAPAELDTNRLATIQWDELNPRAIGFVKDYLEVHEERLIKMKDWGQPYFLIIENILKRYRLPATLKYLAVIESDLNTNALSTAGAVGPWQLMPGTARDLGLVVNESRDDRTDLNKSTHAAAKYLMELHKNLGDWLLVVAAYNGGPARVENIITKKKSRDFWNIQNNLPTESRNHVKKFIATHYIFERNGSETTGLKRSQPATLSPEELAISDTISITGKYIDLVIANYLAMDIVQFNTWNPGFNEKVGLENYVLRLPKDKLNLFQRNKSQIIQESLIAIMKNGFAQPDGFPKPVALPKPVPKTPKKK